MRSVTLFIAMSVDGYIADQNGGVDWLQGHGEEPDVVDSYGEFIKGIDTVLMGWNTYHQVVTELSPEAWPYDGLNTYVFTHRTEPSKPGIAFTGECPSTILEGLKQQPGKGIWVCGGANLANQLMRDGLVDRLWISVIPTLLGGGVRLFQEGDGARLRLLESRVSDGIVDLIYDVLK